MPKRRGGSEARQLDKQITPVDRDKAGKDRKTTFEVYREGNTTPAIRLTARMVLAGRRWRALLDEALRPTGHSSARLETLAAIFNSPPMSPQVDIARRLRIEGPTLTRMLDGLEKEGLVERLPDPADRRSKRLRVTEKGENLLEEMFAIADTMRERLLENLSDRQIDETNQILGDLIEQLDRGLLPGE